MGWRGFNMTLLQPGKELWKRRAMIQKGLSNTATRSYWHLLEDATRRFVARVSGFQGHPEVVVNEYVHHNSVAISNHGLAFMSLNSSVFRALSKLFIKVAYGDALSQRDIDELVVANTEAQRRVSEAFIQLWLVNFIPWSQSLDLSELPGTIRDDAYDNHTVKWTPTWTPGAVFHRVGAECKAFVDHIRYRSWEVLLKSRVSSPLMNLLRH